jgi:GrpB-like predicted nucleotidyltransferase (UPF0157 family)
VPGLAAKPIIDLMAATGDLDGVGAREGDLHLLGYGFHDTGMPGRLLYRRGPASARAHHLHVVQASTLPTRNQLLLRDYLRGHLTTPPGTAHSRDGSPRCMTTETTTPGAKTELIQELTYKARAERGLPPAPVWEE